MTLDVQPRSQTLDVALRADGVSVRSRGEWTAPLSGADDPGPKHQKDNGAVSVSWKGMSITLKMLETRTWHGWCGVPGNPALSAGDAS